MIYRLIATLVFAVLSLIGGIGFTFLVQYCAGTL